MMSEKQKEKEEEREETILDHFYHKHPLRLTEAGSKWGQCYGCTTYIYSNETAYTCRDVECGSHVRFHEECAEMPREITLSMHPQHTLIQNHVFTHTKTTDEILSSIKAFFEAQSFPTCAICQKLIFNIGYHCTSSDPCGFQVHVGCVVNMPVLMKKTYIDHPSHPHQLTLLWRPGRSCSFRCDACRITQKGNSYICSDCQYWIHESCAALPALATFQHHHHPLSLIYHLTLEYIKFKFKCHICFKDLLPKYWAYHCGICRYVVHIKCAINNVSRITNANAAEDDALISFPTNNGVVEEMIASFVTKVAANNPNEIPIHHHHLHLISSPLHGEEEDDDDVDDDEDDEHDDGKKSELVCDGCTMAINSEKKYMSCGECKYFLHLPCSQLPPRLLSHPLHPQPDHDLILQTSPKLDFTYCDICRFDTNGLFYKCTKCDFIADIKCASLPDTIKHEAHPYHHLKLLDDRTTSDYHYRQRNCAACGVKAYRRACYICDRGCQIIFHSSCVMLPASVTNPTWDKHPLPLTFDASVNRPGDFYCDVCEREMNPKSWMYHCRDCDVSIHPRCFPTASGDYRNIKFRQRYLIEGVHHHPLAYRYLPEARKLRCDVCGRRRNYYDCLGFQCDSHKCNFFMCLYPCGDDRREAMKAVD